MHSRELTSNQKGCAVGAKLVPEGREEVDELEDLGASLAAGQLVPQDSWQQKEDEVGQEARSLQGSIKIIIIITTIIIITITIIMTTIFLIFFIIDNFKAF